MDFWVAHSWGFVLCMCFFPRLTMLLGTAVIFGPLAWIGWFIMPRLTCAIFATSIYWDANPTLVVFTWLWALGGELTEKKVVVNNAR